VAGATFAATAANHNAVIAITTEPGQADTAMLRRAVLMAFAPFGSPLHTPALGSIHLHGTTGILARGRVSTAGGIQRSVEAVAVSRQGRLYTLLGVVIDARARTAPSDVRAVQEIIAGVRFF
jgi:hypothetical protein